MANNRTYYRYAKKATRLRLTKSKTLNTIIAAVVILAIVGVWLYSEGYIFQDKVSAPETGSTASDYSEWSTQEAFNAALDKVASLEIVDEVKEDYKYNRVKQFGTAWKYDFDKSGCDTRDDILKVSLEDVEMEDKCKIASGTLRYDPYTGESDIYMTSTEMGKELDGEHIVALESIWFLGGAQYWNEKGVPEGLDSSLSKDPQELREQVANDPLNVIMVDSSQNRSKKSQDISEWNVPENNDYQCEYSTRQVEVKDKYGLTSTKDEQKTFKKVLTECIS